MTEEEIAKKKNILHTKLEMINGKLNETINYYNDLLSELKLSIFVDEEPIYNEELNANYNKIIDIKNDIKTSV